MIYNATLYKNKEDMEKSYFWAMKFYILKDGLGVRRGLAGLEMCVLYHLHLRKHNDAVKEKKLKCP